MAEAVEQHPVPVLADKVRFLMQPGTYAEPTSAVEAIETHMSWVFLTDAFAYKLKKPVRYDYLDFSTPEARRSDCEEELRLNRRLAPDVYLEVVALCWRPAAGLSLRGEGEPVDWLVKMRRLPQARMLDVLSRQRVVTQDEVRGVAHLLATFYASAPREDMSASAYRERLAGQIAMNQRELSEPAFGLDRARVIRVADAQRAFLREQAALCDARVAAGLIVEGHGDLRPEHVCLLPRPVVIDCLEFKRDFRIVDPLDELAGLALHCEHLGMPEVGRWLLAGYAEASGDQWPQALLRFYQSGRALLRARLAIWHLRDDGQQMREKWLPVANQYLELAERHIAQARRQGP